MTVSHLPTLNFPIILSPSRNHHCQSPILVGHYHLPFFKLTFAQLRSVGNERWISAGSSSKCMTESDWTQLGEMATVASARLTLLAEGCMAAWQWVAILLVRVGSSYYEDENGIDGVWRRTIVGEACKSNKDDDKG